MIYMKNGVLIILVLTMLFCKKNDHCRNVLPDTTMRSDELHIGIGTKPKTLDPQKATGVPEGKVIYLLIR